VSTPHLTETIDEPASDTEYAVNQVIRFSQSLYDKVRTAFEFACDIVDHETGEDLLNFMRFIERRSH
jgi:hypothetical protein